MKISVIIPAYNCEKTILSSLETVLNQSHKDIEIVVVDDCSSDGTKEIVSSITDSRLRLVSHETNKGAAAARNTGINATNGDWLAFLDADDTWLPEKLARQLQFTISEGLSATTTQFVLNRYGADPFVPDCGPSRQSLSDLVWGCYISPGSTLMLKRDLFTEIGFQDTNFARLEDWDWLLRFAIAGNKIGILEKPLALINVAGRPSINAIEESLSLISRMHKDNLQKINPLFARNLEAGIAIERAAQAYRYGRKIKAFLYILKSLWLCPFNNKSFSKVVLPRLM